MNLTGRTRYRTGHTWWGKEIVVLQVEYTFSQTYLYGPMPDFTTVYKWRDAKLTDLTMLKDRELSE
jgi:hypothetical protein